MERDALLAHGTSFLLQDRLMNCSDYSTAWVCRTCGSMISLGFDELAMGKEIGFGDDDDFASGPGGEYCRVCRGKASEAGSKGSSESGADLEVVAIPYVFRLLLAELSSMGIQLRVGLD